MKLLPDSTLPLIFFMSWVEIFDFIMARPASVPRGREGLQKIQQDIRKLSRLLTQDANMSEMMQDFEQDLTSLPTLSFTAKDLELLKMNITLAQLYSGLKSFQFYLDWFQREQEKMEMDFSKTKKINQHIKAISPKVLKEIGTAPSDPVYPTLPPLNSFWSMYQTTMEIHKKLYFFCDWYSRALRRLQHG